VLATPCWAAMVVNNSESLGWLVLLRMCPRGWAEVPNGNDRPLLGQAWWARMAEWEWNSSDDPMEWQW
jgi:hypothetical protein